MIDENFILSASQVEQYLQRLGLDYKRDKNRLIPSEENLKYLHTIHISKIPYENLSILLDEPISLNGNDNEYPRTALRFICGKVQTDGISEYKFTQDEYYGYIMWQKGTGKEWCKIFGFDESPQSEIDFVLPNYYCETHPDSPFIGAPHMSICPINQHITIAGREFTISEKDKILVKRSMETKEEFILLCKTYFGIEIREEKADVIMRKILHKS